MFMDSRPPTIWRSSEAQFTGDEYVELYTSLRWSEEPHRRREAINIPRVCSEECLVLGKA